MKFEFQSIFCEGDKKNKFSAYVTAISMTSDKEGIRKYCNFFLDISYRKGIYLVRVRSS